MSVDLLKICDPWAYYSQFLFESVYPDGRSIDSFRPVSLQMGVTESAAGSSVARQGGAMITARIEPFLAALSDDPVIVPHIEAAPVISQRVVEEAEVLLNQLVKEEAFFRREQLLTANGRLTWILHLHISILSVDGCLLDALVACTTGALLDLELPQVQVDLDPDITVDISEAQVSEHTHRIPLADIPVLSTFILTHDSNNEMKILCDPVAELFDLLPGQASLVVGNNGRIYRTVINGHCGDEATIRQLFQLAASRQKLVSEAMLKARDAHLKKNTSK